MQYIQIQPSQIDQQEGSVTLRFQKKIHAKIFSIANGLQVNDQKTIILKSTEYLAKKYTKNAKQEKQPEIQALFQQFNDIPLYLSQTLQSKINVLYEQISGNSANKHYFYADQYFDRILAAIVLIRQINSAVTVVCQSELVNFVSLVMQYSLGNTVLIKKIQHIHQNCVQIISVQNFQKLNRTHQLMNAFLIYIDCESPITSKHTIFIKYPTKLMINSENANIFRLTQDIHMNATIFKLQLPTDIFITQSIENNPKLGFSFTKYLKHKAQIETHIRNQLQLDATVSDWIMVDQIEIESLLRIDKKIDLLVFIGYFYADSQYMAQLNTHIRDVLQPKKIIITKLGHQQQQFDQWLILQDQATMYV